MKKLLLFAPLLFAISNVANAQEFDYQTGDRYQITYSEDVADSILKSNDDYFKIQTADFEDRDGLLWHAECYGVNFVKFNNRYPYKLVLEDDDMLFHVDFLEDFAAIELEPKTDGLFKIPYRPWICGEYGKIRSLRTFGYYNKFTGECSFKKGQKTYFELYTWSDDENYQDLWEETEYGKLKKRANRGGKGVAYLSASLYYTVEKENETLKDVTKSSGFKLLLSVSLPQK